MSFPISKETINEAIKSLNIKQLATASIRDLVALANVLEKKTGTKFVRMEMGVPGLPSPQVAIDAEAEAMQRGVSAVYPNLDGLPELKTEIARFAKLFLDVDVEARHCVPAVGSTQSTFASFLVANSCHKERTKGTLFIDPGFNVNKLQARILQQPFESFDVFNYRGEKLREKLESILKTGQIQSILYSNPNNPTWQCFTPEELQIIGELATKYDVIVIEDLAYFGMDFRQNYGEPGVPPFFPSVAHYTDNYLLLVSSSKAFSYAGQRVGMMIMSPALFSREFPDLETRFGRKRFGEAMISAALYGLSAGVTHSAQCGLAALLKATNDGIFNFIESTKIYGDKSHRAKKMFTDNGFRIIYDKDGERPIGDGFYFTVGYNNLDSNEILELLLRFGMCALTLDTTGSDLKGVLRICTSLVPEEQLVELEKRLQLANESMK